MGKTVIQDKTTKFCNTQLRSQKTQNSKLEIRKELFLEKIESCVPWAAF